MENSRAPKVAVCILRVEERRPYGVVITVIMTPDVETVPRGETHSVTGHDEAIRLVKTFLQQCISQAEKAQKTLDISPGSCWK